MTELIVQIDRFVDEHQPGFVACSFTDALGTKHVIIEKVPVITTEDLWSNSLYPRPGAIACQVQCEWHTNDGRFLVQINTQLPWHVESIAGDVSFVVLASQVRNLCIA